MFAPSPSRRRFVRRSAASALALVPASPRGSAAQAAAAQAGAAQAGVAQAGAAPATRPIPSSGETIPAVGLGTWVTFNVGKDRAAQDSCAEVMRAFFAHGGRMIDSSPMYGSSQDTIGHGLRKLGAQARVFAADKVWISSGARGAAQIEQSRERWGIERFDLLQVHNLLAWEPHLATLLDMKASGRVRYVGITTSEGRRHEDIERVMRTKPLDFVQITYNPLDREVEARILPLARERGIAVIANRPFREGSLLAPLAARKLPAWAAELGCTSWAQLVLKFIVSHPAVTCAIPATTQVAHVQENLAAALGPMADERLRARIAQEVRGT